jgi:hypothetical protein
MILREAAPKRKPEQGTSEDAGKRNPSDDHRAHDSSPCYNSRERRASDPGDVARIEFLSPSCAAGRRTTLARSFISINLWSDYNLASQAIDNERLSAETEGTDEGTMFGGIDQPVARTRGTINFEYGKSALQTAPISAGP